MVVPVAVVVIMAADVRVAAVGPGFRFERGLNRARMGAESGEHVGQHVVGADAQGAVYLAHDNNRGQTGDRFFADHWIMMYAQGEGVVPIVGSAHYPNPGQILETIPDSAHFQFRGTVGGGRTQPCGARAHPTARGGRARTAAADSPRPALKTP
jgi:hypothetical protein